MGREEGDIMFSLNIKRISVLCICLAILLNTVAAVAQNNLLNEEAISINVNGNFIPLDANPFIENDRTLIPLRAVMEALGAEVEWDAENEAVRVYTEEISIELYIGQEAAKVIRNINETTEEKDVILDAAAKIVNDRTFVPVRFIAESLGAKVGWEETRRMVIIETATEEADEYAFDIRGIVTEVTLDDNNGIVSILVEGSSSKDAAYDSAIVKIDEETIIYESNTTEVISADYISEGKIVEVVFDGPVAESYPVQARAKEIRVYENNLGPIEEEIGESLEEMGKAIAVEKVKEMTMYSLMGEEVKTFTQEEIEELVHSLNTSPTYTGAYILMLAGNSITITLEDDSTIQLTSFGSEDHVVMAGEVNGEHMSYCIMSSKVGSILLSDME